MDLYHIIGELVRERNRLQAIIASLESMDSPEGDPVRSPGKRRGRKSMNEADREIVSARMKSYWAKRKAERDGRFTQTASA